MKFMNQDIKPILNKWRYRPNDINVRLVEGLDGVNKLQMRLDLGILQMELDGRPDGTRPKNHESYLEYYLKRADEAKKSFSLSPADCLNLQQEAIQYYHRYLGLMKLGDYRRVVRDTQRNLHVFDFVGEHAGHEEIKWSFEQYRAYVIMMNVRAKASMSLEKELYEEALAAIERGIERIGLHYNQFGDRLGDEGVEIDFLQKWADEIREKKPATAVERLQDELQRAIEKEQYERAAVLRDKLNSRNKTRGTQ